MFSLTPKELVQLMLSGSTKYLFLSTCATCERCQDQSKVILKKKQQQKHMNKLRGPKNFTSW